MTNLS
jgi:epidermal growth factor receptor substrate 15